MGTDKHRLAVLGQPMGYPDDTDTGAPDFAAEHEDTAVDKRITAGTEVGLEAEAPRGWSGMDR